MHVAMGQLGRYLKRSFSKGFLSLRELGKTISYMGSAVALFSIRTKRCGLVSTGEVSLMARELIIFERKNKNQACLTTCMMQIRK